MVKSYKRQPQGKQKIGRKSILSRGTLRGLYHATFPRGVGGVYSASIAFLSV